MGSPSIVKMARNTKRRPHYSKRRRSKRKTAENKTEPAKNDLTLAPIEPSPISIDKGKLREEAIERAKKRPIRERILAFFVVKPIKTIKS